MRPKPKGRLPLIRLSLRVLAPLTRLARRTGITCSELLETMLIEIFEGDVASAPPAPSPPRRRHPAAVIPIGRARRTPPPAGLRLTAAKLCERSEELHARSDAARARAAAACEAARRVREQTLALRQEYARLG